MALPMVVTEVIELARIRMGLRPLCNKQITSCIEPEFMKCTIYLAAIKHLIKMSLLFCLLAMVNLHNTCNSSIGA